MAFALSSAALLGIRITQAIFAIVVLGTVGAVPGYWTRTWHAASPSSINFMIFVAVWTLLALVYLTLVPMRFADSRLHHHNAILTVEAITMLFWFAGFIAEAVFLTGRICYGEICNAAIAGNVFGAFEWLLFAITTAFAVLHVTGSRRHATTTPSHAHTSQGGAPQMTVNDKV